MNQKELKVYVYSCENCGWHGDLLVDPDERDKQQCPSCGYPLERVYVLNENLISTPKYTGIIEPDKQEE